jgi:hypothetical protein
MAQYTGKQYLGEVKSSMGECPRCDGWVSAEPAMTNDAYLVCLNCGWEESIRAEMVAGARVNY